jgi:hypothetical protein
MSTRILQVSASPEWASGAIGFLLLFQIGGIDDYGDCSRIPDDGHSPARFEKVGSS